MNWWIAGPIIWLIAVALIIAFLKGADVDDD